MQISKQGYVRVDHLIQLMNKKKFPDFDDAVLQEIVATDEKKRYRFLDESKQFVRANQGHSIDKVKLDFKKAVPPVILYHGTDVRGLEGIKKTGIQRIKRHHVHLTDDPKTATSVGMRHGAQVLIEIDTQEMLKDGIEFLQSENGVWLTNYVDIKYFKNITTRK